MDNQRSPAPDAPAEGPDTLPPPTEGSPGQSDHLGEAGKPSNEGKGPGI